MTKKLCSLIFCLVVVSAQLFIPTAALAAAGDVATSYDAGAPANICGGGFVAFTASATSAALNCGKTFPNNHTVTVIVTGAPAGCTVNLQGDIGGANFADISGNQTCTSSITFHVASRPVGSIKINLSALSGGTAPTVTAFYGGVK